MSGMMDSAAAKIRSTKKGDLKPKAHHFFYLVVWLAGWLTPPLAVLIRFGFGRDFFINILCTICGYFPGHIHNFYCQTIRNNNNKNRTPKWAVKYGLVRVKDKRGGKHLWAGRYDERLPDSARQGYDDDSLGDGDPAWDGHGPEPLAKDRPRFGGHGDNKFSLSPWDREVEPEEVEGYDANANNNRAFDPIDNESFYSTTGGQTDDPSAGGLSRSGTSSRKSATKGKKPKGIKGILSHRDRYESSADTGDRFDRMAAARGGAGNGGGQQEEEYQDEFEAELNRAASSSKAKPVARYDSFEQEGPEDAWRVSVPASGPSSGARTPVRAATLQPQPTGSSRQPPTRSNSVQVPAPLQPTKTGGTVRGTKEDDDLFNHTF